MTPAKVLAQTFMLGFRENLTCPDVAPSEYEGVMAYRIQELLDAETKRLRAALAVYADKDNWYGYSFTGFDQQKESPYDVASRALEGP